MLFDEITRTNDITIPADILALKQLGVDEWHARASWPVHEEEFSNLVTSILQCYGQFLNAASPAEQDIFLADFGFISFLIQHLHASLAKMRAETASIPISYSDLARPFYEPDWHAHAIAFRTNSSIVKRFQFRLREAVRRFRFNHQLPLLERCLTIVRSSEWWSLSEFSEDKRDFLGSTETWVEIPYLESFLTNSCRITESQRQGLLFGVNRCLDAIISRTSILKDLDLPITDIAGAWARRLGDIYEIYLAVMDSERLPKYILASGLGNTPNRIMALAAKRKGTHVVAFSHGNNACMIDFNALPFLEWAICNEFVSISKAVADYHTERNHDNSWSFCSETTFSSLETSKYSDLFQSQEFSKTKIKSVMVAGYPMLPERYLYGTGDFFPFRLSAELDVVKILRDAGYHVIYKPHPDTQKVMSEIMESRVDEIIHEPFETVINYADCIVFTYTVTTTLGAALATKIPIVLFSHDGRPWNRTAYDLLKCRCAMVPTSLDENGRSYFSKATLLNAISRAPTLMDHSYLDKYLSPARLTNQTNLSNPS